MLRAAFTVVALLLAPWVTAADFRAPTEEAVVLFDAPSAQAKKLFIVNRGYPLEVIVVVQGWVKVRDANGTLSWVDATKVSNKPRTVMVKELAAPVRATADDTAPVLFQVRQDVILDVTEFLAGGAWLRVRHRDGVSGFIRVNQVWGV